MSKLAALVGAVVLALGVAAAQGEEIPEWCGYGTEPPAPWYLLDERERYDLLGFCPQGGAHVMIPGDGGYLQINRAPATAFLQAGASHWYSYEQRIDTPVRLAIGCGQGRVLPRPEGRYHFEWEQDLVLDGSSQKVDYTLHNAVPANIDPEEMAWFVLRGIGSFDFEYPRPQEAAVWWGWMAEAYCTPRS